MSSFLVYSALLLAVCAEGATRRGSPDLAHAATTVTTDGNVVTLDWAKCCDCEPSNGTVKTTGHPCVVALTTAHTLRLHYGAGSTSWAHNVIEVASENDMETCQIPSGATAHGQTADQYGAMSMDYNLTYTSIGTHYYVCSVFCTASTGGTSQATLEHCHCMTYNHKLQVIVSDPPSTASLAQTRVPSFILKGSFAMFVLGFAFRL